MPRLGVPSTTDSAPRPVQTSVANRPLTAATNSRHYSRLGGPLPQILQPLIESPKKGRKEGAWGSSRTAKCALFGEAGGLIRWAEVVMTRKTGAGLPASTSAMGGH